MGMEWKTSIFDEDKGQVVRVFRVSEVRALIANVRIEDEGTWKHLQKFGMRTVDVQMWLQAALFTGMRFSELVNFHARPHIFERDGTISYPYIPGGKQKGKASLPRTIYLSNAGKKVIPEFLKARTMPYKEEMDIQHSCGALTDIIHKAGTRIGLEDRTFTKQKKHDKLDPEGNIIMQKKTAKNGEIRNVPVKEVEIYQYTTNGATFRSMRKTCVSWHFVAYQQMQNIYDKIFTSMGHLERTSAQHYLNFRFDSEDVMEIRKIDEGFGMPLEQHT